MPDIISSTQMCVLFTYIEPRKKEGKNGSTYSSNKRVTHQQKMGCEICFPPFFGFFGVALAPSSYYPGTAAAYIVQKMVLPKQNNLKKTANIVCIVHRKWSWKMARLFLLVTVWKCSCRAASRHVESSCFRLNMAYCSVRNRRFLSLLLLLPLLATMVLPIFDQVKCQ